MKRVRCDFEMLKTCIFSNTFQHKLDRASALQRSEAFMQKHASSLVIMKAFSVGNATMIGVMVTCNRTYTKVCR